jgi:hypothetical protein
MSGFQTHGNGPPDYGDTLVLTRPARSFTALL